MARFEIPVQEGTIASPWGPRKDPITGAESFHYGVDFAAPKGAVALVSRAGKIAQTGYNDVRGNFVVVKTDQDGTFDHYWHLDKILVPKVGLQVFAKQAIGLVGQTGRATGPHLHFETRPALDTPNGGQVEPGPFFGLKTKPAVLDANDQEMAVSTVKGAVVYNLPKTEIVGLVLAALFFGYVFFVRS